ncbi:hypothetical protein D3C76_1241900 [compost metagenome]
MQRVGSEPSDQIQRDLFEHLQVAEVFGSGRGQVVVVEIETRPQGMFTQACRRDVAFGAHHGTQRLACRGLGQAGDLSANALERQPAAVGESLDLGGAGQHHGGGLGK